MTECPALDVVVTFPGGKTEKTSWFSDDPLSAMLEWIERAAGAGAVRALVRPHRHVYGMPPIRLQ
jgi:hypothetical protein